MLVGHSMGGGLAVWAAASKRIAGLEGVVVIDVVEGTALGKAGRQAGNRREGVAVQPTGHTGLGMDTEGRGGKHHPPPTTHHSAVTNKP